MHQRQIGRKLPARTEESIEVEAKIACQILNQFFGLGRTESERVAQNRRT